MGRLRAAKPSKVMLTMTATAVSSDGMSRVKPSVYLRPTTQATSNKPASISSSQATVLPNCIAPFPEKKSTPRALECLGKGAQIVPEGIAQLGVLQSVFDRGPQIPELAAAIVAHALELAGIRGLCSEQSLNGISQLDFAARTLAGALQTLEDSRRQQVAPHYAQGGRRLRRLGLFHDAADPIQARLQGFRRDDAVMRGFGTRHLLHADDAARVTRVHIAHLLQSGTAAAAIDQIVGQQHVERLIADHGLRAQHRVTQAQGFGLADIYAGDAGRHDVLHEFQLR